MSFVLRFRYDALPPPIPHHREASGQGPAKALQNSSPQRHRHSAHSSFQSRSPAENQHFLTLPEFAKRFHFEHKHYCAEFMSAFTLSFLRSSRIGSVTGHSSCGSIAFQRCFHASSKAARASSSFPMLCRALPFQHHNQ